MSWAGRGRLGRVAVEGVWVGIGQLLSAAGSVVGVKLLTEVMDPASYGIFSLAVITSTLLHTVFWGALSSTAQRYYSAYQERGHLGPFLQALRRHADLATLLVGCLAVGLAVVLAVGSQARYLLLSLWALLFTVCYGYAHLIDGVQNAARNRVIVSLHSGGLAWLRFGLAFLLVAWLGDSSTHAMAGFALAAALVMGSEWWFFRRKIAPLVPPAGRADTLEAFRGIEETIRKYAVPSALLAVLVCLQQAADRWALQLFQTTAEVGLYSALFQIGFAPVALLSGFLLQVFNPYVFGKAGTGTEQDRVEAADRLNYLMMKLFVAALAGVVALLYLCSDSLGFLLGARYRSVIQLLPLMVMSGGIYALTQHLYNYFMIRSNVWRLWWPTLTYSLGGLVIVVAFAWQFGLAGVVAARLLVSVLYLLIVTGLICRLSRVAGPSS